MGYLGIVLFFWILGGTGLMAAWADKVLQHGSTIFFRPARSPKGTSHGPHAEAAVLADTASLT